MTQEEIYSFCYSVQQNEDDGDINIRVFPNDSEDNDYELCVVCNGIYHYMTREHYEELKDGLLSFATDDFNIIINEQL